MCASFQRRIDSPESCGHFLVNVLGLEDGADATEALALEISDLEALNDRKREETTLSHAQFRAKKYRSDAARERLRRQVVDELYTQKRPAHDDDIRLGIGGALPRTTPKQEHQAWLVIGPPAAGKSRVCGPLADKTGSIILDADYAKRKLPEYQNGKGASLVHDESSALIFGGTKSGGRFTPGIDPALGALAMKDRLNLVIPRVGDSIEGVRSYRDSLASRGYGVHLVLVALDRCKTTRRALARYQSPEKRYVPLAHVFDDVGNEPLLVYFLCRDDAHVDGTSMWASTAWFDNDVPMGSPPALKHSTPTAVLPDF
jgi:hypothetical protein